MEVMWHGYPQHLDAHTDRPWWRWDESQDPQGLVYVPGRWVRLDRCVLLPVGVFAVLGHFFLVELNSGFVAAILTILGFSVHDTIVVFDRIRENLLRSGGKFDDIVERSVNETIARSVNTTITTLIPLLAIFFWGGETLKYFSLALIIGMIAGTYSSIFLASPLLVVFQKKSTR